jgi:hypothetical protein
MSWLSAIASFLGMLFAKLIPAIGTEIRKNNEVKYIGADDESEDAITDSIIDGID